MKTPAERAHLLLPNTPASMDDKWRAAWSLLDEDKSPAVLPEHRAHARCWLTYRAIDGHVSRAEFEKRVQAVNWPMDTVCSPRWSTSIAAAEFYLFTLWDDCVKANKAADALYPEQWKEHPSAVLSYLRIQVVKAYTWTLKGYPDYAKNDIHAAVNTWKDVMASIDWQKHPLRFMDGKGDMMALHALMCIGARLGLVPEWMREHEKAIQQLNEPWVRCLKHLSLKKGAIWS